MSSRQLISLCIMQGLSLSYSPFTWRITPLSCRSAAQHSLRKPLGSLVKDLEGCSSAPLSMSHYNRLARACLPFFETLKQGLSLPADLSSSLRLSSALHPIFVKTALDRRRGRSVNVVPIAGGPHVLTLWSKTWWSTPAFCAGSSASSRWRRNSACARCCNSKMWAGGN
jgi:hypothetical protein